MRVTDDLYRRIRAEVLHEASDVLYGLDDAALDALEAEEGRSPDPVDYAKGIDAAARLLARMAAKSSTTEN